VASIFDYRAEVIAPLLAADIKARAGNNVS